MPDFLFRVLQSQNKRDSSCSCDWFVMTFRWNGNKLVSMIYLILRRLRQKELPMNDILKRQGTYAILYVILSDLWSVLMPVSFGVIQLSFWNSLVNQDLDLILVKLRWTLAGGLREIQSFQLLVAINSLYWTCLCKNLTAYLVGVKLKSRSLSFLQSHVF